MERKNAIVKRIETDKGGYLRALGSSESHPLDGTKITRIYRGWFKGEPCLGKCFYLQANKVDDDDNYLSTEEVSFVMERKFGYVIQAGSAVFEIHLENNK